MPLLWTSFLGGGAIAAPPPAPDADYLLLSGDEQSGTDAILLSGDEQSGSDLELLGAE
jgi:hypothetical protein